jgi:hypothetical protein
MLTTWTDCSVNTEGCIGGNLCLVIIDTGISITIVTTAGLSEREREKEPSLSYVDDETTLGETLPVLKLELLELTLRQSTLRIWVFIAKITHKSILGQDFL